MNLFKENNSRMYDASKIAMDLLTSGGNLNETLLACQRAYDSIQSTIFFEEDDLKKLVLLSICQNYTQKIQEIQSRLKPNPSQFPDSQVSQKEYFESTSEKSILDINSQSLVDSQQNIGILKSSHSKRNQVTKLHLNM